MLSHHKVVELVPLILFHALVMGPQDKFRSFWVIVDAAFVRDQRYSPCLRRDPR